MGPFGVALAVVASFAYIEIVQLAAKCLGALRGDRIRAARWIVGIAALLGALEQLVVGSGWNAFWLAVPAALLLRGHRRGRVAASADDDPRSPRYLASEYRRVALTALAFSAGGCALALAQFTGVGLHRDNGRGVLGLIGAIAFLSVALIAYSHYRRATRGYDATTGSPVSDGDAYRDLSALLRD